MLKHMLLVVLTVVTLVSQAYATHLQSEAQYVTWHTDATVTNQAEFATFVAGREDQKIADAYNLLASPAFWVWKTAVSKKEIYEGVAPDSSSWSYTIFMNQTVQQQNAWFEMFATTGTLNMSLSQNRAGIQAIFGSSNAETNYIFAIGKRQATRLEKLLANTSGGAGTSAAPATLTYEGTVRTDDVAHMLVPSTPLH